MGLRFSLIPGAFAIVKLPPDAAMPRWATNGEFCSVTRTAHELSIVCLQENVLADTKADTGWICLKLHGPFAFSETGILASFIGPLSSSGIPIFAISTFDTDYVLIKQEFAGAAFEALGQAGHEWIA